MNTLALNSLNFNKQMSINPRTHVDNIIPCKSKVVFRQYLFKLNLKKNKQAIGFSYCLVFRPAFEKEYYSKTMQNYFRASGVCKQIPI